MADYTDDTVIIDDCDEAIMPDGWTEEDDIFDSDSWGGNATEAESEASGTEDSSDGNAEDAAEESSPTTEGEADSADSTEGEAASAPTKEPDADDDPMLTIRVRYNHEDKDVTVRKSELPKLWQQAQYVDDTRSKMENLQAVANRAAKAAKLLGYDTADEMFDATADTMRQEKIDELMAGGMSEATAKEVAELLSERKISAPAKTEEAPTGAEASTEAQRDFATELSELYSEFPDMRGQKLPDEVVNDAIRSGRSVSQSYARYAAEQQKQRAATLEKENRVLKQNAKSAAHAPVKGSTGAPPKEKPLSEFDKAFLKGFDSGSF